MESNLICPNCHTSNRLGAKFCAKCGRSFATIGPTSSSQAATGLGQIVNSLGQKITQLIGPTNSPPTTPFDALPGGLLHPQAAYARRPDLGGQDWFFAAEDREHQLFLIVRATRPITEAIFAGQLATLTTRMPGLRPVHDVILSPDGRTYLALPYPQYTGWHLWSDAQPSNFTPEQVMAFGEQLARGLDSLHRTGYTLNEPRPEAAHKVLIEGDRANIIDLSTLSALPTDDGARRQAVRDDIFFVTRLLYLLLTGRRLSRDTSQLSQLTDTPRSLRVAIQWSIKGNYVAMAELLAHLQGRNLPPLRLTSGKATHAGRVRDHNEDQLFAYEIYKGRSDQPLPAFYMVADGMGGHESGEVASDTISSALKDWLDEYSNRKSGRATQKLGELPDQALQTAVQAANEAVFKQAQRRGNNMGSTVTAMLVIGERAYIANVGDSRTYLYRGGQLRLLTRDHSLVYSLYQAQQISYDDIYTHPQRNQIYRSLGEQPTVDVEVFIEPLAAGDVLLLCSDGLWEMVRDKQLKDILHKARQPQEAAEKLIDAANLSGGEDNISAVVVRVD